MDPRLLVGRRGGVRSDPARGVDTDPARRTVTCGLGRAQQLVEGGHPVDLGGGHRQLAPEVVRGPGADPADLLLQGDEGGQQQVAAVGCWGGFVAWTAVSRTIVFRGEQDRQMQI